MASLQEDEGDGIFKNIDDSFDEVDASAVFTVIERESVPDKFVLQSGMPVREKSQSYLLLPRSFGSQIGSLVEPGGGVLGLITVCGDVRLDADNETSVIKHLLSSSEMDHKVAALRRSRDHLLFSFDAVETYEAWGNFFLSGKLQTGSQLHVSALEPAIFCSVPRALVSVTSQEGHDLHATFVDPIIPFSASFTHLRIIVDSSVGPAPSSPDIVPHLGIVLMCDGRNHTNALKMLERLKAPNWKPLPLSEEVRRDIGLGLSMYQNSHGGPLLGVNTGCPQAGVRIMVLVKTPESFTTMVSFYKDLLGVDTVSCDNYAIFPLSMRTELMVTFIPGVKVATSSELDLIVKVKTAIECVTKKPDAGAHHIRDPEGNSVIASMVEMA